MLLGAVLYLNVSEGRFKLLEEMYLDRLYLKRAENLKNIKGTWGRFFTGFDFYLSTCAYFTIAKTSCGRQTTAHQPNWVAETGHEPWGEKKSAFQS